METSHQSIFDDIGDTDFLDAPISSNHTGGETITFEVGDDDGASSLSSILQTPLPVLPNTSSQLNGLLNGDTVIDDSPITDYGQPFSNSPIQIVKSEPESAICSPPLFTPTTATTTVVIVPQPPVDIKPLLQLATPHTPTLVNNKATAGHNVAATPQLMKLVQNCDQRVHSPLPQLLSATGNNGQLLATSNGQVWQQNSNNLLIQQMQQTPQQPQYVMTDQQGQKWTQVQQPAMQQTLQVIQTSQGNKILVPAGQQLVNSNGQLTMMASNPQPHQVVLQPLQQQQNIVIRPNVPALKQSAQVRSNSQIVQIKINNQLLNITYEQLKQLQGIPTKPAVVTNATNKKVNSVKVLPQTMDSLAEEKKLLLALTFRNNVQQNRLEQLMKISTDQQALIEKLDPYSKDEAANKILPGWYKLPMDVYQKVLLQLNEMPKDQRDLFYLNQPKILKRFELQFQKHQQQKVHLNSPISLSSPIMQTGNDIIKLIPAKKQTKISAVKLNLSKVKTPKKSNTINLANNMTYAFKQQLLKDQHNATNPDCNTPFSSMRDIFDRLLPYHVFQTGSDKPEDVIKGEQLFDEICADLIDRKESLLQKFKLLLLKDSMRDSPGPEHVMMLRRFVKDERFQLNKDKEDAAINPDTFKATPFIPVEERSSEEYTLKKQGDGLKLVFGKNPSSKRSIIEHNDDDDECGDDDFEMIEAEAMSAPDADEQFESPLKRLKPCGGADNNSNDKMASIMVAPSAAITVMDSEADLAVAGLLNCGAPTAEEIEVEQLQEPAEVQSSYDWSLTDKELDDRFDAALAIPNANNQAQNLLECRPEVSENLPTNPPDDLELAIQSILG